MKFFIALLVVLTMANLSSAEKQQHADLILIHGDIYTGMQTCMGSMSVPQPCTWPPGLPRTQDRMFSEELVLPEYRVQAIAVTGDKIVAIGSTEQIEKFKGPKTQVIDLGGHFVMPGFN